MLGMTTTKICPTCHIEKDLELFIKPSLWNCKECSNRWTNEYRRKKREARLAANPKPVRTSKPCKVCEVDKPFSEFNYANRARGVLSSYCKPCQSKLGNAHRATYSPDRTKDKCVRLRTTVNWFFAQLERQNHVCAICGNPETQKHGTNGSQKIRSLAIDHDHATGNVRGLLCFRCNTALYQIEKNGRDWPHKAVAYLDSYLKET